MQGTRHLLLTTFCATTLMVSSAVAQDLRTIYDMARTNDSQFRAAEFTLEAGREARPAARAGLLPQVELTGSTSRIDQSGRDAFDTSSARIDLTQPIFRADNFARYQQSGNAVNQAEATFTAEQQGLILRVAEAYFGVLAAEDSLEFAKADVRAYLKQLDQAKQRYNVGLIAITDVHEAQAAYDLARSNEIQAANNLESANEALHVIVGGNTAQLAKLRNNISLQMPQPEDMNYWSNLALENNPSARAAKEAVEIARSEVSVQKAGHLPTLDLVAGTGESWNVPSQGTFLDTDETRVGLNLRMPIFTGGGVSSNVRKTRNELKAAMENFERENRTVKQQANNAYRGVESAIGQVRALQAATVSAQSAVDATQAGYDVGNRTLVDVLLAQRSLSQARSNLSQARYEYVLNDLRLRLAAGSLSDADVDRVNALLVNR
jgi:outer membrane protein